MPPRLVGGENVINRLHARIVIKTSQGDYRNSSPLIKPRHLGATLVTEYLCKELRVGHLVTFEMTLTLEELHAVHRGKSVRGMRRRSSVTATGAMAIVCDPERLDDVKCNRPAQASSTYNIFRSIGKRFSLQSLVAGFWRVSNVTRQVIGNVIPRRFVCHENVAVRLFAIVVAACGNDNKVLLLAGIGHYRPTGTAKAARQQMR